jgi:hypothetical protein
MMGSLKLFDFDLARRGWDAGRSRVPDNQWPVWPGLAGMGYAMKTARILIGTGPLDFKIGCA